MERGSHEKTSLISDWREYAPKPPAIVTTTRTCAISSTDFYRVLSEAGVLPSRCVKAVITLQVGKPVIIEMDCLADDRIKTVDFSGLVEAKL